MFERLRARLEAFLAERTPPDDPRRHAAQLQEAVVEAKLGLDAMRDALLAVERELAAERRHLADAERRGRLAAEIDDRETVAIAERFVGKHRARVAVLERKAAAQRDELALAERELEEMKAALRQAKQGLGPGGVAPSVEAAWRDLQAAGGTRPEADPADDFLAQRLDRAAHEAAVEAQLAHLKRKLGKDRQP
ncbi:MAG TPA: hypothetical protein VNK43_11140 [Gemmatimonadales bacterium]|nr:hypothetical protein [Gemmatimonadales bacterium]